MVLTAKKLSFLMRVQTEAKLSFLMKAQMAENKSLFQMKALKYQTEEKS